MNKKDNRNTVRRLKFLNNYKPQNEYRYIGPPLNQFMRIELAEALRIVRKRR
jgi:hypothetical protein